MASDPRPGEADTLALAAVLDPEAFEDHPIERSENAQILAGLQWGVRRRAAERQARRLVDSDWLADRLATARAEAAAEATAAVEPLHLRHAERSGKTACVTCLEDYPCPTVAALADPAAALAQVTSKAVDEALAEVEQRIEALEQERKVRGEGNGPTSAARRARAQRRAFEEAASIVREVRADRESS